jgi:hypothetical protein
MCIWNCFSLMYYIVPHLSTKNCPYLTRYLKVDMCLWGLVKLLHKSSISYFIQILLGYTEYHQNETLIVRSISKSLSPWNDKESALFPLENAVKIRMFVIHIPEAKKIHKGGFFLFGNGCACTLCRDVVRSSAMSDTSEAPSLASHVRRVRVPSQASGTPKHNSFFFPIIQWYVDI